jgi:hypothetical protein
MPLRPEDRQCLQIGPMALAGGDAVRQQQGTQQLTPAAWPPALDRIALGKQFADRLPAANEHGPLPQQAGFVDIAVALEAGAGEIRIAKEGKGLEHSAQRWRARQGPKGGGIEGQPISLGLQPRMSDHSRTAKRG